MCSKPTVPQSQGKRGSIRRGRAFENDGDSASSLDGQRLTVLDGGDKALDKSGSPTTAKCSSSSLRGDWDKFTDRLVGASCIPFSILVLPQVAQNFVNMSTGNQGAMSIISWQVRCCCCQVASEAFPPLEVQLHCQAHAVCLQSYTTSGQLLSANYASDPTVHAGLQPAGLGLWELREHLDVQPFRMQWRA